MVPRRPTGWVREAFRTLLLVEHRDGEQTLLSAFGVTTPRRQECLLSIGVLVVKHFVYFSTACGKIVHAAHDSGQRRCARGKTAAEGALPLNCTTRCAALRKSGGLRSAAADCVRDVLRIRALNSCP